jgi:hypothetical protein
MFADQMRTVIEEARTLTRLDVLSKAIWQGLVAGAVTDDAAQGLAELLHARRAVVRGDIVAVGIPAGRPSIFPPRRSQRAPDRPRSIARRRHLAASGPMPPRLAARFTLSELAALRIISDEVMANGHCDRPLAEIAARAGVGRTTVQNALREAASLGLVTVQERRRQGQVNLPNVVRVVSREWLQWLRLRRRSERAKGGERVGFKNVNPTDKKNNLRDSRTAQRSISAGGQKAKPGALESYRGAGGGAGRAGRNG